MNREQLKQANALSADLDRLHTQLDAWKRGTQFSDWLGINDGGLYYTQVDIAYIDFSVVRAVTIATLEKLIAEKESLFLDL